MIFLFNETATTEIYTLSLHDALPMWFEWLYVYGFARPSTGQTVSVILPRVNAELMGQALAEFARRADPEGKKRSEEHTSELQSRQYLVCRLLLEKKQS